MNRSMKIARALLLGATTLASLAATQAKASDITFAVIGPQEYNLPVNFATPFNAFVQYGEWNNQSQVYNSSGHVTNVGEGNLYVGLSKYVRFFTIDGIPDVGFAYEVIVPLVQVQQKTAANGGIGDPLTGPAVWFKPNGNSTLGFQSFVQVPIGETAVSNHYWANYSSMFFDYQWEHAAITGNLGAVFRSTQNISGAPDVDEGTTGHLNVRLSWKNQTIFQPFLALDWQATSVAHYSQSNLVASPASNETALGIGVMAQFTPAASLTLRYSHDVAGLNTTLTNGAYMKFAYVW